MILVLLWRRNMLKGRSEKLLFGVDFFLKHSKDKSLMFGGNFMGDSICVQNSESPNSNCWMNGKGLVMNMNLCDELWGIIQRFSLVVALTFHLCWNCILDLWPLSSCFKSSCFPQMFWLILKGVDVTFVFTPIHF